MDFQIVCNHFYTTFSNLPQWHSPGSFCSRNSLHGHFVSSVLSIAQGQYPSLNSTNTPNSGFFSMSFIELPLLHLPLQISLHVLAILPAFAPDNCVSLINNVRTSISPLWGFHIGLEVQAILAIRLNIKANHIFSFNQYNRRRPFL